MILRDVTSTNDCTKQIHYLLFVHVITFLLFRGINLLCVHVTILLYIHLTVLLYLPGYTLPTLIA